jgi:hypothetical protein
MGNVVCAQAELAARLPNVKATRASAWRRVAASTGEALVVDGLTGAAEFVRSIMIRLLRR